MKNEERAEEKKRNSRTRIARDMYLMAYGLKSIAYLMHVPSFITFLKSKAVLIHNYQKKTCTRF